MEVELSKILINESNDQQVVFLKEQGGERLFPIFIGIYEAAALDRKVKSIGTPRPLTHDLIANVLDGLKVTLERIVISELKNNTFYAQLILEQEGKKVAVDARPSDALVLAIQFKSPIFVDDRIIQEVALN